MNRRRDGWWWPWLPALPALVVVVVLAGGATVGAVATSLDVTPLRPGGWGLDAWRTAADDPGLRDAIVFTVATTIVGTALSLVVGIGLAVVVRGRPWARAAATLPVLVPHLLAAVVAVAWLGPGGLVDRVLGDLPLEVVRARSGAGIVLVHVVKEAPFLALLALVAWDQRVAAREEAAAVLGAGPWDRLRLVVLPALRVPLTIGTTVVAAYLLGSFEVALLVGPTRPDTVATWALRATRTADLSGQSVAAAVLVATAVATLAVAAVAALSIRGQRRG